MKFLIAIGFSAAALACLPATSSGQSTPSASVADSAAKSTEGPAEAWSAKPIGSYDLVIEMPDRKMPAALTISETDGNLSALLWPEGDNDGHVMNVTVKGVDLVLTATAPRGPVTITLERRGKNLSGTWSMGSEGGSLKGSVKASAGAS